MSELIKINVFEDNILIYLLVEFAWDIILDKLGI